MKRSKPMKRSWMKRKPRRPKPGDDPRYREWICGLACLVPGCTARDIEPAHLHSGQQGMGLKSPDSYCVPLCAAHHRTGNDSHHNLGSDELFEQVHGLDLKAEMRRLRDRYVLQRDRQGHRL